jgi:hypothetical protein
MFARTALALLALAGTVALAIAPPSSAYAQAQNPMVGNWTFDAAKSTSSGPMPKKRDLVITQKGANITVNVVEVPSDGAPLTWTFTTSGDGKSVPVTGWAALDTATSTLSGRTGKTTYMKAGKLAMESNTEVSTDGKVLTIKGTRPGPDGKPLAYSSHYDRK